MAMLNDKPRTTINILNHADNSFTKAWLMAEVLRPIFYLMGDNLRPTELTGVDGELLWLFGIFNNIMKTDETLSIGPGHQTLHR